MSIRDAIERHVDSGKLWLLKTLTNDQVERYIFASPDLYRAIQVPFPNGNRGNRIAKMRATLEVFISGGWISVSEKPRDKPPTTFLARVAPPGAEVWSIRCLHPARIRVLGRFSERDHFVALTYEYREDLKGKNFDRARERFSDEWLRLFPGHPLFSGRYPSDYLSKKYKVV